MYTCVYGMCVFMCLCVYAPMCVFICCHILYVWHAYFTLSGCVEFIINKIKNLFVVKKKWGNRAITETEQK